MKLDLHIHTIESPDSNIDIKNMIARAEMLGLDCLAVTDHNSMAAVDKAIKSSRRVTIIPGMEITDICGTHIIGLFIKNEINARVIEDIIDEIHEQDGLVMIPHPFRPGTGLFYNRNKQKTYDAEQMSRIMTGIDLFEAVNFRCSGEDLVATDRRLALYPDIPHAAGSDAHRSDEIGKAYLELVDFSSNNLVEIKEALLAHDERVMRYEAYTAQEIAHRVEIRIPQRSLIMKTRKLVKDRLINPLRKIYNGRAYSPDNREKQEVSGNGK